MPRWSLISFLVLSIAVSLCCSTECPDLHETLSKLNFVNSYQNTLSSGVFFEIVDLVPLENNLELLYFNNDVAGLIDLDLKDFVEDEVCVGELLSYFSGTKSFPGSSIISIPGLERFWIRRSDTTGFVTTTKEVRTILLGTVENKNGESWDLVLKGAIDTKFENFRLLFEEGLRDVILRESLNTIGVDVARTLAFIGTSAIREIGGESSPVLVLQLTRSTISISNVEYFTHYKQFSEAHQLLDFVNENVFLENHLSNNINYPCVGTDDDDDEEDDDEFCHREGLPELFRDSFQRFQSNFNLITLIPFSNGLPTSGSVSLDGSVLHLPYGKFHDISLERIKYMTCAFGVSGHAELGMHTHASFYHNLAHVFQIPDTLIQRFLTIGKNPYKHESVGFDMAVEKTFFLHKFYVSAHKLLDIPTFYRYLHKLNSRATVSAERECSPDESVWKSVIGNATFEEEMPIRKFIKRYRDGLVYQHASVKQREALIRKYHPLFVPRENLINKAVRKTVKEGSLELFNQLMFYSQHIKPIEEIPEEFLRFEPSWPFRCVNGTLPVPILQSRYMSIEPIFVFEETQEVQGEQNSE